jgi:hypothetical protein
MDVPQSVRKQALSLLQHAGMEIFRLTAIWGYFIAISTGFGMDWHNT